MMTGAVAIPVAHWGGEWVIRLLAGPEFVFVHSAMVILACAGHQAEQGDLVRQDNGGIFCFHKFGINRARKRFAQLNEGLPQLRSDPLTARQSSASQGANQQDHARL